MIFENSFDNLREQDVALLTEYFDNFDYKSSAYTFAANYIWRKSYKLTWQIIDDHLCIAGDMIADDGREIYWMNFPLTRKETYDIEATKKVIEKTKEIFKAKGQKFRISIITEPMIPVIEAVLGPEVELIHSRDDDDYIYLKEDLVTLSGRKLHHKKNHLNYFLRNYAFTYEEYTPDMYEEVMDYVRSKNEYKLGETPEDWKEMLEFETDAISEFLKLPVDKILTGIIRIGGKIEAVALGEFEKTHNKEMVIVHFEKADDRIRGLYQAINNEFCKRLPEETVYVNREEDMGLDNLRQTKLSYKPCAMYEKYYVRFKNADF